LAREARSIGTRFLRRSASHSGLKIAWHGCRGRGRFPANGAAANRKCAGNQAGLSFRGGAGRCHRFTCRPVTTADFCGLGTPHNYKGAIPRTPGSRLGAFKTVRRARNLTDTNAPNLVTVQVVHQNGMLSLHWAGNLVAERRRLVGSPLRRAGVGNVLKAPKDDRTDLLRPGPVGFYENKAAVRTNISGDRTERSGVSEQKIPSIRNSVKCFQIVSSVLGRWASWRH